MEHKIPNTIGYDLNKAFLMLDGYQVQVKETSVPFHNKQEERKENTPVVVRQLELGNCVYLTVSKFK